jgi:threonine/homoserine/homoserine lactone efflux protein
MWSSYGTFLVFAAMLVLVPGPDFAVVTKNTLASGRRRGSWCAAGVASSNTVQGTAAATGLGALVVRAQPLFEAIKWAGVAYLAFLGAQALRSALRGRYAPLEDGPERVGRAFGGWRQGFVSNITNPKVLVFYLAVLPQFLSPGTGTFVLLAFAVSHAALSLLYLLALTTFLHRVRRVLTRRRVRRALDAATGTALLAFGTRLAAEQT